MPCVASPLMVPMPRPLQLVRHELDHVGEVQHGDLPAVLLEGERLRARSAADVEHALGLGEQGREAVGQRPGALARPHAHRADERLQRLRGALEARRPALSQHLGQLHPAAEEVVEVQQAVADEGVVGGVQERSHVGRHDDAVAPPLEVPGVDEHGDHAQRRTLVQAEFLSHLRRRLRPVEERRDQADLERRHEDDLWLPLAREEICACHDASLLPSRSSESSGVRPPSHAERPHRREQPPHGSRTAPA